MTKSHPSRRRAFERRAQNTESDFAFLDSISSRKDQKPRLKSEPTPPSSSEDKKVLRDKKPLLALASLLLLGGIGVTLAYSSDTTFFLDRDTSKIFSVRTTHEYHQYNHLTPGDYIDKTFTTTNTGDIRVAVRYYYIAQWTDKENQPLPLGFVLEDEELGSSTQLAMQVYSNTAKITEFGQTINPWKTDSLTTTYCTDQTVIFDPEHYSCQQTTDDPTLAYSVLVGPFTYYRTLGKDESTATSPISGIQVNSELATFQHHTRSGCTFNTPEEMYLCDDPANFYEIEEGRLRAYANEIVKVETVNDSPYAGSTFNLATRVESIEGYAVHQVWANSDDVYDPYPEFPGIYF